MSMASYERDYGYFLGATVENAKTFDPIVRRQVYQATHRGDGTRLPLMNRSFISFTYGGKRIEDFDLIATFDNRLDKNGYSSFNDLTSTYDNLEGQQYWNTHYTTNTLQFTLSTDGIDQKTLDEFLHWFSAGVSRMLVLAEHPNRYQYARVAEPPQLSLLPFEYQTDMMINNQSYPITTTLYKGDITLKLIMDDPHWIGITNVLGEFDETNQRYNNTWKDPMDSSARPVDIFSSPDAMKILYEDGIPLGNMIDTNIILGNGEYASVQTEAYHRIWSTETDVDINGNPIGEGARIDSEGASIDGVVYFGRIAGAFIKQESIDLPSENSSAYFYYAGTAPAPTRIEFKLTPKLENYYITSPKNNIGTSGNTPYNTITIQSVDKQELKFTTPNLFTSYNQAIKIFKDNISETNSWEKIYQLIRDEVRHPAVRAWVAKVLDFYKAKSEKPSYKNQICAATSYFLKDISENNSINQVTFIFDSKTGEASGEFKYRAPGGTMPDQQTESENPFKNAGIIKTVTENVGDMLYSNYIVIKDRNYPNNEGKIVAWNKNNPQYSHKITHDVTNGLNDVYIYYKNMYL